MDSSDSDIQKYTEFWNKNIQDIEEIKQELELSVYDLEKKYGDFEKAYSIIEKKINLLGAILSGFNTIRGREQLLKLRSVIRTYRRRYTREGINFRLITGLLNKISDIINESMESFPDMIHEEGSDQKTKIDESVLALMPYRWLTFEKNGSWFIAAYEKAEVFKASEVEAVSSVDRDYLEATVKSGTFRCRNLFPQILTGTDINNYYIILNGGVKNYAASKIGKRIFARTDFISGKIEPYNRVKNSISPGRVKIFGKNHIMLA